jgi:hypothetical protein
LKLGAWQRLSAVAPLSVIGENAMAAKLDGKVAISVIMEG